MPRIMRRITPGVLIVLGAATLILNTGCGDARRETVRPAERPLRIRTETVRMTQAPVTVTAVGTTEPFARATPGTRIMGRVASVTVSEGDRVPKGAVLARIESEDLQARRRRAESGVRAARIALDNAEATITRMRNLYRDRALPKQRLDEAETAYARAQAGMAAAESALREVKAGLDYSVVKAPFAGVITRKFVQPGDMAAPAAPLFAMERQRPIKITVEVNERDLAYVRPGGKVFVDIEAAARTSFEGKVDAVIPSADPGSRTFRVKVVTPNPEGRIRTGLFARVRFPKGERPALLIPEKAVARRGQLHGVFIIDGNTARLRWIRVGKTFGDRVEALSGLAPGMIVAVSGADRLRDGLLVSTER